MRKGKSWEEGWSRDEIELMRLLISYLSRKVGKIVRERVRYTTDVPEAGVNFPMRISLLSNKYFEKCGGQFPESTMDEVKPVTTDKPSAKKRRVRVPAKDLEAFRAFSESSQVTT